MSPDTRQFGNRRDSRFGNLRYKIGITLAFLDAICQSPVMHPERPDDPNLGLKRTWHQLRASGVKVENESPLRSGVHNRGYLPHVKREGAAYFVTFRLADSLPREELLQFQREKAERLRRLNDFAKRGESINDSEREITRDFQRKLERHLDRGAGTCQLRQPEEWKWSSAYQQAS